MTKQLPFGSASVMNMRVEPDDSLDDFPTPPWATRSLFEHVLWPSALATLKCGSAYDPACGRLIMSSVFHEYARTVLASDIFDYTNGCQPVQDYLTSDPVSTDWIITNPPFKSGLEFTLKALDEAREGVAMLCRSNWKEGVERYELLFSVRRPAIVAQFVERVPMVKGRWDPDASTATSYSWFVWYTGGPTARTDTIWIPPGRRKALTKPDDAERFANRAAAPLLEGAA